MKLWIAVALLAGAVAPARAADSCPAAGDLILAAQTPEVDLYDGPQGKRVQTLDAKSFPACVPITGRAPNMMLQVSIGGKAVWVPPYMVKYRFCGKMLQVCRNLAMGSNQEKVGATRGLGEGCPKPGAK